jgi:hypothetical protein
VSYGRGSRSRLHHFEGSFTATGGFELHSPVRTLAASADDAASRVGGRYEYRRYPWRDLWTAGFDVGIGVEGSGEHLSFVRHFEPGIELQRGLNNLGTAAIVAARWQRSPRWSVLAAWANGLTLGRSTSHYRGDVETTQQTWGGGWQSNLDIRGEIRVASRATLAVGWFTSGEGRHGSHDSFTYGRSRYTVGVTYGR